MPSPASQPEKKVHQVWWDAEGPDSDWERILQAAGVLAKETELTATATDIIRIGTRRYVDELLGADQSAQKAS